MLTGGPDRDTRPVDAGALRDFLDPRPPRPVFRPGGVSRAADTARLAGWVAALGEGERNRGLFWAACRLAEAGAPPASALDVLGPAGERAGLPPREVFVTIRSAYRTIHATPKSASAGGGGHDEIPRPAGAGPWAGALMIPGQPRPGGKLAVGTAVAGTVLIAAGAFWLSFTALADLARRSGIDAAQAWAWPVIVDGMIVVATVAVVALAGLRAAWYPWVLLAGGALISVTANALHAVVAADADVPGVLAACVAAVPPLVLLASTHLTVVLIRSRPAAPGRR